MAGRRGSGLGLLDAPGAEGHLMAELGKPDADGPTHVARSDDADLHHAPPLPLPAGLARVPIAGT